MSKTEIRIKQNMSKIEIRIKQKHDQDVNRTET